MEGLGLDQGRLEILGTVSGVEVYVWRPGDLDAVAEILRRGP